MKRFIVLVMSMVVILFGVTTSASADIWTNTVDLDRWLWGSGTSSWQHTVTTDFSIPYDTLNSATLSIYAFGVDNNNDNVIVEGVSQGVLNSDGLLFFEWVTWTNLSIGSVITPGWISGAPLDVTLAYNETQFGSLRNLFLDFSTLSIDYTNGAAAAAVPEPCILLLIGPGLAVIAGIGRKKKMW